MSHSERAAELRLTATELWAAGCIACDRHSEVIPELRKLVEEQPLREGLWLQLMRALDGAGRHAEALGAYAQAREAISEELGVEPGAELQRLYADLLAADNEATAPADRAATSGSGGPGRSGRPASEGRPDAVSREGERTAAIPAGDVPGTITMGNYADLGTPPGVAAAPIAQVPPALPAGAVIPRPTQLPADIGDFTGREAHVRHLCDMLASGGGAAARGRCRSRSSPAPVAWERRRWPCTPPTRSAISSRTGSCTWTCSGRPASRCRPATCSPGSCAI